MAERDPPDGRPVPARSVEAAELERRLLWAERMECLAALAAGLTHSLCNLLASTLMSVELVLRSSPDGVERQLLTSLQTMTREGLEMVRQLLGIARGVDGEAIVFQPQHLLVELQRLLNAFMPSVPVVTDYPQDLWPLSGDPHRFVQLALALCLEARRHLSPGAALVLSAANVAGTSGARPAASGEEGEPREGAAARVALQVEVRQARPSSHPGAPAAGRRPGEAAATPVQLGRPAGLWLVERPSSPAAALAITAGGTYQELAPEEGGGARVLLPAASPRTGPAAPVGEPPPGNGAGVLVCEEEPMLAQALCEVLAAHGYRAEAAPLQVRPQGGKKRPRTGDRGQERIVLATASLDDGGRWRLASSAPRLRRGAGAAPSIVLMIDAETAERQDREKPGRRRGPAPVAILRKPFTARELLFALAAARAR